ncbi:MAG: hypothetical protein AAF927_17260 [Bacteroidota bacterium]
MLTIFATTNHLPSVKQAIAREDRLDEIVFAKEIGQLAQHNDSLHMVIDAEGMHLPYFWDHSLPPYRFPETIAFDESTLLGLIFHLLGNDQKSWQYLNGKEVYHSVEQQNRLRYGQPVLEEPLRGTLNSLNLHNQAVLLHYGVSEMGSAEHNPADLYRQAVNNTNDPVAKAFSLKELATIYLDHGYFDEAEKLIQEALDYPLPKAASEALKLILVKIWIQQLNVPYDEILLAKLKTTIWEVLTYYEQAEHHIQVGLLLLDAIHIAQISNSFAEALGYSRRAIEIFEEAGLTELAANAHLKKGTLLYAWAQNGNPQFYRPAVEAYQKAVMVFTKENAPAVFADIQHHLAVLYAEMPADNKKRSVWAGVAASSFEEALMYYSKETHPYEYASICNNYGNALTKFPPSRHTDNFAKAIHFYNEALSVRTITYPYERAISLLNYLEASWNAGNVPEVFNDTRYRDMQLKAQEVIDLVDDPEMQAQAKEHLENLKKLKEVVEKEAANA